jgi:hypothetical protein
VISTAGSKSCSLIETALDAAEDLVLDPGRLARLLREVPDGLVDLVDHAWHDLPEEDADARGEDEVMETDAEPARDPTASQLLHPRAHGGGDDEGEEEERDEDPQPPECDRNDDDGDDDDCCDQSPARGVLHAAIVA